jgi:hypothetical protein
MATPPRGHLSCGRRQLPGASGEDRLEQQNSGGNCCDGLNQSHGLTLKDRLRYHRCPTTNKPKPVDLRSQGEKAMTIEMGQRPFRKARSRNAQTIVPNCLKALFAELNKSVATGRNWPVFPVSSHGAMVTPLRGHLVDASLPSPGHPGFPAWPSSSIASQL